MKSKDKDILAKETINTVEEIMGKYRGYRRAHARGHVYEALFTPTNAGSHYSSSALFQNSETKAIVRYSHSSPDPTMADALSPIKGMAVKFLLPDGNEINMAGATVPIFVAKEPEAFLEMLRIGRSMKKGKPRLSKMVKLIRNYPESRAALKLYRKIEAPKSFANGNYYSIHAFYLVNKDEKRTPVKFIWEPADEKGITKTKHNTMEEEFDRRLTDEQVKFNLAVQLGEERDPCDNPTIEWPKKRVKINVGHLIIQKKLLNQEEDFLFDPTLTGNGIECSEDKILRFRKQIYSVSHERRKKQE